MTQFGDDRLPERFWHKVKISEKFFENEPCWEWTASVNRKGYGTVRWKGPAMAAHRVSYSVFVAELRDGLHIHHRCENRPCVNPKHLQQVTPRENTLAGYGTEPSKNLRKTHCPEGHELTGENLVAWYTKNLGSRVCRECHNARTRAQHKKRTRNLQSAKS